MRKRISKLHKRIAETLDIPDEVFDGTPKVTLIGGERMIVENHNGIFEYRSDSVRLMTKLGILRISGDMLSLLEITKERMYVTGSITAFEYEK